MYIVINNKQEVGIVVFTKEPYVAAYATEEEAQKRCDYMNEKAKQKGWCETFDCVKVKVEDNKA